MAAPAEQEINTDFSVHQPIQRFVVFNGYPSVRVGEWITAGGHKYKVCVVGGSNNFVDDPNKAWRTLVSETISGQDNMERDDMEMFREADTCCELMTRPDPVGEGRAFKKITQGVVCFLSNQERLRENGRELYRCMSICDQAIAHDYTLVWLYDTAASFSVTGNAANLQGIHAAPPVNATVANGQTISSHHCGRVVGDVSVSGVRYIPGAPDLISGGHLARLGCCSITSERGVTITKDGMVVGHGRLLENNTYTLDFLADNFLGTICVSCPWPHGNGAQLAATSSN